MALAIHRNTWATLLMGSAYFQASNQPERMKLKWPAEEAEDEAFDEVSCLPCGSREGAAAMLAHLEWYLDAVSAHPTRHRLAPSDVTLARVRMSDMRLVLGDVAPVSSAPILAAIEAHRAAWLAYLAAPGRDVLGFDAWWALRLPPDAAADTVLATPCGDRHGAAALVAHVRWYAEELELADENMTGGLDYAARRLQARGADLSLLLRG
ncbi:hypothetical protein [Methylobacterium sp. WL120]|uniref:hypothetical protein n=1 Tax=Methylobacterium sp. WL120 TaxID=2603887 RepID=UPI0011CAFDC4|nr:hypothetical protein [Methylobacterium sp. WL120]TXM69972.1 hypothetical protein FV229_03805 [Methylobacterium sp. WL120]